MCTKSPYRLEAKHGSLLCRAAVARGNLVILAESGFALDQGEQAAFVSGADDSVALRSLPRRVLRATMAGCSEMSISIRDQAASGVLAGTPVITFSFVAEDCATSCRHRVCHHQIIW